MSNKKIVLLAATVTAIITALVAIPIAAAQARQAPEPQIQIVTVEVEKPNLSPAQIIWFARLMQCESGIKATAVNPKDLDNTPSYGILQFKPGTFNAGVRAFGLSTTTSYMDPEAQVAIVEQWILQGGINWHTQFPACTTKLGLPPAK